MNSHWLRKWPMSIYEFLWHLRSQKRSLVTVNQHSNTDCNSFHSSRYPSSFEYIASSEYVLRTIYIALCYVKFGVWMFFETSKEKVLRSENVFARLWTDFQYSFVFAIPVKYDRFTAIYINFIKINCKNTFLCLPLFGGLAEDLCASIKYDT